MKKRAGTSAADRPPISATTPGPASDPAGPTQSLDDPRVLQVLASEHSSLLATRSLAYNEAFTRTSMFLTFLSMSFVGLALIGPPLAFGGAFLIVAAIALAFDVVIGFLTYLRVADCNAEDFRAMQGMNRIRHGYTQVVPSSIPYFITGRFDDSASVGAEYGPPGGTSVIRDVAYGLSTSLGLVGIVVSLVGGILGAVFVLLLGAPWPLPLLASAIVAIALFVGCAAIALRSVRRIEDGLTVRFPRGAEPPAPTGADRP